MDGPCRKEILLPVSSISTCTAAGFEFEPEGRIFTHFGSCKSKGRSEGDRIGTCPFCQRILHQRTWEGTCPLCPLPVCVDGFYLHCLQSAYFMQLNLTSSGNHSIITIGGNTGMRKLTVELKLLCWLVLLLIVK
jgi:hypothetical protein